MLSDKFSNKQLQNIQNNVAKNQRSQGQSDDGLDDYSEEEKRAMASIEDDENAPAIRKQANQKITPSYIGDVFFGKGDTSTKARPQQAYQENNNIWNKAGINNKETMSQDQVASLLTDLYHAFQKIGMNPEDAHITQASQKFIQMLNS